MYDYLEIAEASPRNRGRVILCDELRNKITKGCTLYRSMYIYPKDIAVISAELNSIKSYSGPRHIDKILIDIDRQDNSDLTTLNHLRSLIFELQELGLGRSAMQPYFSGTGYHLSIPNEAFGFTPSKELPIIVKNAMRTLGQGLNLDLSIYSRTGIYRVAHTMNRKSGLYKIPLTIDEVNTLTPETILEMAKSQRLEFPYEELFAEGELESFRVNANSKPDVKGTIGRQLFTNRISEPHKIVTCVQTLLKQGPMEGSRHNASLRIISHCKRNGMPSEFAKVLLLHWNNNSMDEELICKNVETAYNANYRYGCNDSLLASVCSTKCVHFKRKDYSVAVKNAQEMQEDYHERMITDFSGKMVDLGKSLDLNTTDCQILPGELVTIFGATGSNKTTLAQNIALGVDFANDRIVKEWQIPTFFLSLELSAWYMHRRHLQIASGLTKEAVNADYVNIYDKHKHELEHLVIQTVSPTIEGIMQKIKELQPSLVVVDYIDLVETPQQYRGEYEKIRYVSHQLSNMAVNLDLIIIQISQVSREYSRNDVLDLYAGKGSGAIENASRKVIGLHGQSSVPKKQLRMFKNTDGELFNCDLEWNPSFRMQRIPMEGL